MGIADSDNLRIASTILSFLIPILRFSDSDSERIWDAGSGMPKAKEARRRGCVPSNVVKKVGKGEGRRIVGLTSLVTELILCE